MATHEPLSDEQLAFYKKILTERKRELLKQVLNQDEDLDEIRGDVAADPLDAAGNASSLELMTTLGNHERNELAEIDNALQKIENGSYGFCEESGETDSSDAARGDAHGALYSAGSRTARAHTPTV